MDCLLLQLRDRKFAFLKVCLQALFFYKKIHFPNKTLSAIAMWYSPLYLAVITARCDVVRSVQTHRQIINERSQGIARKLQENGGQNRKEQKVPTNVISGETETIT
jgi:hypothetical protein